MNSFELFPLRVLGMLSSSFWLGNIGCKYLNASLCMSPDSASAGLMFNLCSGFLLQRLSDSLLSELFILCEAILEQPYSLTANQSILTARKYPEIHSVEDREQYKAVFNDQYLEYKELHREITATLIKFQELDSMMSQLINNRRSPEDSKRIMDLVKTYDQKKNDQHFLEKKERCEYLKAKLSHIKMRIHDFDRNFTMKDSNY
uniref:OCEL domain-containing protein n=1 Tax=Cyprinus carpio carpio TaxID=630221 RepID=A0A8C1DSI9_CYPCA